MTSLEERKAELLEEFEALEEPQDRLVYLVERGREHPVLPDHLKVDVHRVPGCLSKVWVVPGIDNGVCQFRTDSDAQIPKGIATILVELLSGCTPDEILTVDLSFLHELGIAQHLTPNRRNALSKILELIKHFAGLCVRCDAEACGTAGCAAHHEEALAEEASVPAELDEERDAAAV